MSRCVWIRLCLVVFGLALPAAAQNNYLYATGSPPFGVNIPIEGGFINVANGNVHLEIPLATTPQRGSLQLDEKLVYDSRIWMIGHDGDYSWWPTNVPNSMDGWRFAAGNETGTLSNELTGEGGEETCAEAQNNDDYIDRSLYLYSWTDPSGTVHTFEGLWELDAYYGACAQEQPWQEAASSWANDSSGYFISMTGTSNDWPTIAIFDKTGTQVYPQVVDRFGNYWSSDGSGNLVDDQGRTPVLTSTSGNQIYYDVLTDGGSRARYTVTTEPLDVSTDFGEQPVQEWSGTLTAIQSIQLPDGSSYSFSYDTYGEMTSMTLPTGGAVSLAWSNYKDSYSNENRWATFYAGGHGAYTFAPSVITQCSGPDDVDCQEQMKVTDADSNDTVYTLTLDDGAWKTATAHYQGAMSSGDLLLSTADGYVTSAAPGCWCPNTEYVNPGGTVTTLNNGLSMQTQYGYATPVTGQVTSAKLWDYYSGGAPSAPTVDNEYTYSDLFDLGQAKTLDGSGNQVALANYTYTGSAAQTSGLTGHDAALGTGGPYLSSVTQGVGTTLTTNFTNDDAGAQLTSTGPNGQTGFARDATDSYVTTMTPPTPSSGVSLPQSASYDPSTGLLASTTDPNGETTAYSNYDWAGRAGQISYPDGGGETISYSSPTLTVDSRTMNASTTAQTQTLLDGYGRLSRVAVYNGQGSNPWYQTDYCYGADGRLAFKSYAYEGPGFSQAAVCSGAGDSYGYDALGRVTRVTHADASSISYAYSGRATEVTDENGVSRITQVDALGRTTSVCEISSNSSMPGSGSPVNCGLDLPGAGFLTTYSYKLADHTTTVVEGAQTRIFQTDSLGRAVSVQEPESGTTTYSYAYNGTGLVVTRTKPQANQTNPNVLTTTTTQYDSVGRLVSVNYSDGTPSKYFDYDQATIWGNSTVSTGAAKGRLTAAYAGNDEAFIYDPMGRVLNTLQCIPGWCGNASYDKWTPYTYDWMGDITSAQDGGGVTSTYTYSPAGEVDSITSSLNDGAHPPNLVSNVQNGPNGPTGWQLGNGLTAVKTYDQLGRVNGGWVCNGSSQPGCNGGTQTYGFVATFQGTRNLGICDTAIDKCEGFGYDEFNRLTSLTVTQGAVQNYSYVYDRYGNRWQQNALQGGWSSNLSFNTANNQINTAGYVYDAAGNLINDGVHSYTYDAEGNLTQVDGGSTAIYEYSALNQRVRIDEGGNAEGFIYNQTGQRMSVWDINSGTQMQGETYWGQEPVEYNYAGQATYFHGDWLGTGRVYTDYNGNTVLSVNSLPFGDGSQFGTVGYSPWTFAYVDEDYYSMADSGTAHAQYRQYGDGQGRWFSPDPYSGSYDFTNPQSLNRYSYVMNNPLTFTDPSGRAQCVPVPDAAVFTISCVTSIIGDGICGPLCGTLIGLGVGALVHGLEAAFGLGAPQFHGSLKPRPNALSAPNNGTQPKPTKPPCPPLAHDPNAQGIDTLLDGIGRVTQPLSMIEANASIFIASGAELAGGALAISAGCLEPTLFEPATCLAGGAAGGATIATGVATGGIGAYFFKNITLPAIEDWGCQ